jgi:ComF family protein
MSRSFWSALRASGSGWLSGLPSLCASCGDWGTARVCHDCIARFAQPQARCRICAEQIGNSVGICGQCLLKPPALDATWAAVDYAFPWADIVAQFKFRQGLDLSQTLATLMAQHGPPADGPPRLLLPAPLSQARIRQRGYNQAWELTRKLSRLRAWPAQAGLLIKTRDTAEQMSLPLHRRQSNVNQAFGLAPGALRHLEGQRVVLVDDVMTTGATLGEAARLIRGAGAASVEAWVFARTPSPRNSP